MNTKNKEFQIFDPNPSIRFALEFFLTAGISRFALIGKLAMWIYLEDESQHEYTRDVDFAVFFREIIKIEDEASKQGLNYEQLHIGGIGIREKGLNIDFIDWRLHGVDQLFTEAIENASGEVYVDGDPIPVVSLEHLIAMKIVSGEPKDDKDLKTLLALKEVNYEKARSIVEKYLGSIIAERLDVFAREVGLLPKRGPYIYGK
jgi:predicted nucleotidyltransferase